MVEPAERGPESRATRPTEELMGGSGHPGMNRPRPPRFDLMNVQMQTAEAQKIAARSMQNVAKYMLWSAILAAASTVTTATVSLIYLFRAAQ